MKKKLKKYQSRGEVKRKGYMTPVAPKDTTGYGSAADRIRKALEKGDPYFYKTPESVGGRSGNIDPGFSAKPEKVGGTSKNIDPGFSVRPGKVGGKSTYDPGFGAKPVKKKNGGAIKPKKKK